MYEQLNPPTHMYPSSHLNHVPVDQILFLKTRVRSKIKGQGTLVTSEGGRAHFWDMHCIGPALGESSSIAGILPLCESTIPPRELSLDLP